MRFSNFLSKALPLALAAAALAQTPGVLSVVEPAKVIVKRGEDPVVALRAQLQQGYHVNSDKPSEAYLIPLRLTWEPGPLEAADVSFPQPKMEKYEFSEKPLSVFSGAFDITTKFKRTEGAMPGPAVMSGKLRYQACNDKMCLPPKSLQIKLPLLIQ